MSSPGLPITRSSGSTSGITPGHPSPSLLAAYPGLLPASQSSRGGYRAVQPLVSFTVVVVDSLILVVFVSASLHSTSLTSMTWKSCWSGGPDTGCNYRRMRQRALRCLYMYNAPIFSGISPLGHLSNISAKFEHCVLFYFGDFFNVAFWCIAYVLRIIWLWSISSRGLPLTPPSDKERWPMLTSL